MAGNRQASASNLDEDDSIEWGRAGARDQREMPSLGCGGGMALDGVDVQSARGWRNAVIGVLANGIIGYRLLDLFFDGFHYEPEKRVLNGTPSNKPLQETAGGKGSCLHAGHAPAAPERER